jgi:hypothetical protein
MTCLFGVGCLSVAVVEFGYHEVMMPNYGFEGMLKSICQHLIMGLVEQEVGNVGDSGFW